jgi:hypothetical protein
MFECRVVSLFKIDNLKYLKFKNIDDLFKILNLKFFSYKMYEKLLFLMFLGEE